MAPENTMEAFELAAKQGVDGIEMDIHLTADHQLAVIHDYTLDRTTNGTGIVENYTMAELKKYDASYGKGKYAGARIPELRELYDWMKGNNIQLNLEIKAGNDCNPQQIISILAKLEKEYDFSERIIYSSFNHYAMVKFKERMPHACVGLLYEAGMIDGWKYAKALGADCLHPYYRYACMGREVENAHDCGLRVNVWTVDEVADMEEIFRKKCNIMISNKPYLALEVRKGVKNEQSIS
jgi:glycerophosphoryl diester phosphodiesterase